MYLQGSGLMVSLSGGVYSLTVLPLRSEVWAMATGGVCVVIYMRSFVLDGSVLEVRWRRREVGYPAPQHKAVLRPKGHSSSVKSLLLVLTVHIASNPSHIAAAVTAGAFELSPRKRWDP